MIFYHRVVKKARTIGAIEKKRKERAFCTVQNGKYRAEASASDVGIIHKENGKTQLRFLDEGKVNKKEKNTCNLLSTMLI